MTNDSHHTKNDGTCQSCKGSGEVMEMTQHLGPDDYEVPINCPKCGGTGAVSLGDVDATPLTDALDNELESDSQADFLRLLDHARQMERRARRAPPSVVPVLPEERHGS
jgi:hypothetical protein